VSENYLKRFTNLPALIYLLTNRSITLLDPKSWDDTNDSHYLSIYKDVKSLKTVLALCFTEASETYHHWRVFADSASGVCITFNRDKLLRDLRGKSGVRFGSVDYLTLTAMRKMKNIQDQLPFIKRHGFHDEREFRIIYEDKNNTMTTRDVEIPLTRIERITLSPWLPKALDASVKDTIHAIPGCEKIKIARSTLVSNTEWKKLASKVSSRA
jgi:hypothetical protein